MNVIIPDEGLIKVLGRKMDEKMKEKVGYLPEDRGLYPKMKVGEILLFLAELKGIRGVEARKRIDFWLEKLDLADWKLKKVEEALQRDAAENSIYNHSHTSARSNHPG